MIPFGQYVSTLRAYLRADARDAQLMATLARTRSTLLPHKRLILLSGLAAFNRNVTGD